ncbi:MAG: TIGR01212 family radical SAM protein [Candidatus Omnitrophota bacterium]|nr:MAG: TIGR01212 family radical SAM protein [Candidatus Omnitrophota bacterium]
MKQRYYSFSSYLRERFGERVHRISINAGFSCPNLDGTKDSGGCIFCNNKAFSYFANLEGFSLEEQIAAGIEYGRRRFKAKKFILYFQSFSNTYGDINFLKEKYSCIKKFDNIVGLAVSTRPDCIDEEKLNVIERFKEDYEVYVEYGLGSVHNKTLGLINRNHKFADFQKAVALTQEYGINTGAHLILGLPGETASDMFATMRILSKMPLWGVKFHCLHVVKDTHLEQMYRNNEIKLLSEDEYVNILVRALELIPKNWVILRLVSDADRNLLVAPFWLNDKHRILKKIEEEFNKRKSYQGLRYESTCN